MIKGKISSRWVGSWVLKEVGRQVKKREGDLPGRRITTRTNTRQGGDRPDGVM